MNVRLKSSNPQFAIRLSDPHLALQAFHIVCLLAAFLLQPPGVAAPAGGQNAAPAFRPDRILIKPKPERDPQNLARFHAAQGVRVLRQFPRIESVQVLELPRGADVATMLRRYQQSGLVAFGALQNPADILDVHGLAVWNSASNSVLSTTLP